MIRSEIQPIAESPAVNDATPFVSVVIPVFNDAVRLQRCLEALEQQTYPSDRYEVIVVDNGSDSEAQIAQVVAACPQAIVSQELTPGSYAARNKGISMAQGEVIAFTDADCIPALNWIEQGVRYLTQTPNCGLVVGRIEMFFEENRETPVALYESVTAFPQEQLLKEHQGGATANVFTFKRVIEQVGAFNPYLKARGDLEWGKRVYQSGYSQQFASDVQVAHPARSSYSDLYKRTVRLAGGIYDLQQLQSHSSLKRHFQFSRTLIQNLVPPVSFIWNTLFDPRLPRLDQKLKVAWVMILVRYVSAWEMLRLKLGGQSFRG
ncbi:glycosyltransferase [Egbenema bharatensis]|uniref:glycosyltransferase n=1 Tax=Egbenema bharatensis TaxID=3463334 RepID=UPI003A89B039